jgi:hypothetical protein
MGVLNTLRGPRAHCSPLAEDEVVRLLLEVREWFRLMHALRSAETEQAGVCIATVRFLVPHPATKKRPGSGPF